MARNLALSYVVKSDNLWKVAKNNPRNTSEMLALGLSENEVRVRGKKMLQLLAQSRRISPYDYPKRLVRIVDDPRYKKAIRLVGMCLLAGLLIFAIVFINWKITERNMNQAFEMNAEKLGFVKGELYELEKDNVRYRLPNQKLPFLKKDFHVKNSYADFMIEDIEISISIYDGEDFAIEFNHFRSIKGCFDKDSNIEITENTLNEKENIFYTENNEMIEDVLKQLLEIHKNVYRR